MKCVLFYLDTLRPDHLGCYGHPYPTSPRLDKLASEGALFERCVAADVPTQQAFTGFLTGWNGTRNGIVNFHQSRSVLPPNLPFFMEIARFKHHLRTALVDRQVWELSAPWFLRGWGDLIRVGGTAESVADEAIAWLKVHHKEDFILMPHMWDPHDPYTRSSATHIGKFKPDNYRSRVPDLRERDANPHLRYIYREHMKRTFPDDPDCAVEKAMAHYDASIRYMDDHVGRILDCLEELGIAGDALVLVFSDHGESFATRGFVDHWNAYWHIAHVPLLIKYPGRIPAGVRSRALVDLTDCLPTVFSLGGLPVPRGLSGKDLTPILRGEKDKLRDFTVTTTAMGVAQRMLLDDDGWALMHCIEPGFWDHVPRWELNNINDDPNQERNLIGQHPDRVRDMQHRLFLWIDKQLGGEPDPLRLAVRQGCFGYATDKVIGALRDAPEICKGRFFDKARFGQPRERAFIRWLMGERDDFPHTRPPVGRA
ncbi:MAG: sulfatase [Candidatus Sumerlaeota bacterium]|nr:sulfatase [Candidatus Sumerlaeota bacterium]